MTALRRTCIECGSTRRRAYFADASRATVIARCRDCGELFDGDGVTLPPSWAQQSARGLSLDVDPGPDAARAA